MTEAEWLACTDPVSMLEFLRVRANDRKLRLFLCACCRHIWDLLWDKRTQEAITISELYADGRATEVELEVAYQGAWQAACRTLAGKVPRGHAAKHWVWDAVAAAVSRDKWLRRNISKGVAMVLEAGGAAGPFSPVLLLRDVFGNPLRPLPAIDPSWGTWNGGTVVRLAEAIHEESAFDRLPVLADALEDAGCNNADILAHCRQAGPHVRGCWVIDLLLGKE
jgi:hypothetical protein